MKIIYNSKLLKFLQKWSIVRRSVTSIALAEWVLTNRSDLTIYSIKHETKHVHQWRWHLYILFPVLYFGIMIFTGYWNHPYERAARRFAGQEDKDGNLIPGTYGYYD